jgi:hypothetical protein
MFLMHILSNFLIVGKKKIATGLKNFSFETKESCLGDPFDSLPFKKKLDQFKKATALRWQMTGIDAFLQH